MENNKKLATGRPNVVVTGAAGFIGTNLCENLVQHNNVIAIDNFITGSQQNIDSLLQNPNFEFIKYDITEPIDLSQYPELKKFEIEVQGVQEVYHLACPTSPRDHEKYAMDILGATSYGTKNTLDMALFYKAKFIHASSQHVYGQPKGKTVIKENDFGYSDPIGPRSSYDEGKRFSETLVDYYRRVFKLDTKIARIFTTYGPKMQVREGRAVPDFIVNAIQGKDLIVYGDANTENTFCYVDDIVDGLIKLAQSNFNGPVNLGQYDKRKLKEVAELVLKLTESNSKIVYQEPDWHSTSYNLPDITLAKEKLGWFPLIGLEEGLVKTIEFTKANLRKYEV